MYLYVTFRFWKIKTNTEIDIEKLIESYSLISHVQFLV